MIVKMLAASAALSLLALGSAHAQDYGAPPYGSGAYGYAGFNGGGCDGFTIAGAHAGVTVLGIDIGGGARARIGGDCHGYGAGYAPPPPPPEYPGPYMNGGYYNQEPAYAAPVAYPAAPVYAAPAYGYSSYTYVQQPMYAAPCGCVAYPAY